MHLPFGATARSSTEARRSLDSRGFNTRVRCHILGVLELPHFRLQPSVQSHDLKGGDPESEWPVFGRFSRLRDRGDSGRIASGVC